CGSSQQQSKMSQCCTSTPKSLAYSSQRICTGLPVRHSSSKPKLFHSFHSSSICQRARIRVSASLADSRLLGTLVTTMIHCASSHCRGLIGLHCLWARSRRCSRRLC